MQGRLASVHGFPVPGGPSLDLDVHAGEVVRVVGPNGSGKTSLLRALAGLDAWVAPDRVDASPCGFAMQSAMDSLIGLTVDGEFDLRGHASPADLVHLADQDVATLSAGEARRVAVAVATDQGPLLLLDEPSEGLDAGARWVLAKTMDAFRSRGAVVVADHGDHWADLADRTVRLGTSDDASFPSLPCMDDAPRVTVDADTLHLGSRRIHVPPMRLPAGFHVLVGPNGAGKTRTLHHLLDDDTETGDVRMLPAQARDLLGHTAVQDELADADPSVVAALVPERLLGRHPWNLSGGEQQRVALAKVLGTPSSVYLLDEPEAHLDAAGRQALHHILEQRIHGGAMVLAATHDVGLIAAAASVLSMEGP